MKQTWTLVKKEILDARKDKRSLMAALYYAFGSPIIFALLMVFMIDKFSSPDALYIDMQGQEYAPEVVSYLATEDIFPKEEGKPGKDITLIFSEDHAENLSLGKPSKIIIQVDESENDLKSSHRRIELNLQRYSQQIAGLRLINRGVNPQLLRPLQVHTQDTAAPSAKGAFMVSMVAFMILYSVFVSGMNLAIDTSAGERERNSLALLLCQPISSLQIVLSKVFTVCLLSWIGVILTLAISKIAMGYVPWHEFGTNLNIDAQFIAIAILVSIPNAVLAASMMIFVAFMAKSFKEAQSYLAFVMMVPGMLAMASAYGFGEDNLKWLPVSGQHLALMDYVKQQPADWMPIFSSNLGALAIAAILILAVSKMLKSEKVVFGL
ncbi:ABC transporter permease [Paraferrimonas sp. SM1919]|uniref:ABC transporter permease n=1 Tax=Paraferrimonas sp. SM1919 TaxID=2662263 RepID=UPI0013D17F30|nr:ABC transporter permease [Paraferrimonas sp. SM1919]